MTTPPLARLKLIDADANAMAQAVMDAVASRSSMEREGQAAMNALYAYNRELAGFIQQTTCDPFYQSRRLPAALCMAKAWVYTQAAETILKDLEDAQDAI